MSSSKQAQSQCQSQPKPHQFPSPNMSCPPSPHLTNPISPDHHWRITKKARVMATYPWYRFGAWRNQDLGRYLIRWLSRRVVESLSPLGSIKERRGSGHPTRKTRLWSCRTMFRTRRICQITREKPASSVSENERLRLWKEAVMGPSLRLTLIRQSAVFHWYTRTNRSPLPSRQRLCHSTNDIHHRASLQSARSVLYLKSSRQKASSIMGSTLLSTRMGTRSIQIRMEARFLRRLRPITTEKPHSRRGARSRSRSDLSYRRPNALLSLNMSVEDQDRRHQYRKSSEMDSGHLERR